jgi:hypothetical protein
VDVESTDVVNRPAANSAIEDDPFELAFQIALHAQ